MTHTERTTRRHTMSAHANCTHEATKAARSRCRRGAATSSGRKLKTIRRWSAFEDTITLEVEETIEQHTNDRVVNVWLEGEPLGAVRQHEASRDRHSGNIRIPGKRRTYWVPQGTDGRTSYWNLCDSQAEAIRALLPLPR